MSNVGTTATPLSPAEAPTNLPAIEDIKETEMDTALNLFERMATSVVAASQLAKVVTQIQSEVGFLKRDIEHVREQNSRLDEMLTAKRKQIGELIGELHGVRTELTGAKQTVTELHAELEDSRNNATSLIDTLQTVRKDRDDWMETALKADADLQAANAKLNEFRQLFTKVFGEENTKLIDKAAEPSPVQLPSWEAAKEVTDRPGGSTYVSGITGLDDTTAPSAEPQPALQEPTLSGDKGHSDPVPTDPKQFDHAEPEAKPASDRHEDLKPWERY